MKKIIKHAMLFATLLILQLSVVLPSVAEENKTATENELQTEKKIIISTDKSIKIEIKNATLHEVLKEITKKSKIDFEVTENLLEEKISIQVKSPDWPGALKKLLSNYNYANSWRGNKLIKIFVFEHGSGKSMQLIPPGDLSHPELEDIPPEILEAEKPGQDEPLIGAGPEEEMIDQELLNLPQPDEEDQKMIEITEGTDTPLFPDGPASEQGDGEMIKNDGTSESPDREEIEPSHIGTDHLLQKDVPEPMVEQDHR